MRLPAALILCLGLCMADEATAQEVHRCIAADGTHVLTDRRCADVGATEQAPLASTGQTGTTSARLFHDGCARRLSELVQEITSAIASRDVNRLAGIYEWSGTSNAGSEQILSRLESIVQRPLVAILPIRPAPDAADTDTDSEAADAQGDADTGAATATRQPHPIGLRLEQTQADGHTPAHVEFALSRRYGCFWIRL